MQRKQSTLRNGETKIKSQVLMMAVDRNDIHEVLELLQSFSNRAESARAVNMKHDVSSMSAMMVAAAKDNLEMVRILLEAGGVARITDKLGRTPLHHAAGHGSKDLVVLLLDHGAEVNAKLHVTTWTEKPPPEEGQPEPHWGRTPLHAAAAGAHADVVEMLLARGAHAQSVDEQGYTPLLNIQEVYSGKREDYERIVQLLLENRAEVNTAVPSTGRTAAFQAVQCGSIKALRTMLRFGLDVTRPDVNGTLLLHEACRSNHVDILQELLRLQRNAINTKNKDGETPLHFAAYAASRPCLRALLNNGGDLSQTNRTGLSVVDVLFCYLPRPTRFVLELFDSKFQPNEFSINEKLYEVTIDFRILSPPDNDRQMSVIMTLMNAITFAQKSDIVLHPLIEAFVRLKWLRLRGFFFAYLFIHFLFVLSLSSYASCLILDMDSRATTWSNGVLLLTSMLILINVLFKISLSPKTSLQEYETPATIVCLALSLSMSCWYVFYPNTERPEWIRHVASYALLLSWSQLMFTFGQYPFAGHFSLMLLTVFTNVIKVLLFFACLVIGFSMSFCVQFDAHEFRDPWHAFIRTTVMIMGEYDYDTLFKDDKLVASRFPNLPGPLGFTSQALFLLFILVGPIVLMNLLTGVAVSDIQSLQKEGNLRHMIKLAEFLSHIENILSRENICLRWTPKNFLRRTNRVPHNFTFNPSKESRICENRYKAKSIYFPFRLIEAIVMKSVKNQRGLGKKISEVILMKDGVLEPGFDGKEELLREMSDIKTELRILSVKLSAVVHTLDESERTSGKTSARSSKMSYRLKHIASLKEVV